MSSTTVYRRQSMAQLYEKLRAQDDEDDMAWLAQFSPEDKYDEPYVPVVASPAALSTISSESTSESSPSTQCSQVYQHSPSESSDDGLCSDSDSDVDPEPLSLDLHHPDFEPPAYTSLIFLSITSSPVSQVASPVVTTHAPASSIAMRRTTRSARTFLTVGDPPALSSDEGEDAHAKSDGDATEDEYMPSPTINPGKRHRSLRSAAAIPSSSASSRKRGLENVAPPAKRPRQSPLPRNTQATQGVIPGSAAKNPWACPYCKWVQRNHRTPDLKRHIRTHTRLQRPAQWVCCGVPLGDAKNYNLPEDARPFVWEGETMVGGCGKEFSRRDALKRHLDNDHITCVGNFSVFANIYEDDD
ncbi:hypothetical protein PAXRUDRAFT_36790 [Paxillus rubicundulus Ve08.2h10]|uniref:C2H2-type domain-containing protein n=1 Tax=Paxillus rubicundulus Ve08.2h10 TaxID=930991 RepID=A0A0D0D1L3_9AGAM|nr:hypothetical protein PAXRUDRAFT_36790 [Paxillus rubicundulus Ve08.2h10]